MNPSHIHSIVAAAVLAAASMADAAVLASEDFNSYAPSTNIETLSGGTGWGGNWSVGAPGLGYLNETRGALPISYPNYASGGDGTYANLASGFGGPTFNYIQRTLDVSGAFAAYNDGTRIGANGTTLWGSFLHHSGSGMQVFLQGVGNAVFSLPTVGVDSLFLFRIEYGAANADTISIWSNPDLSTWTPAATPTSSALSDYSFQTLVFVAPNNENEGRFDKIVFGSEAFDVVPEPSTYLLFGVSALAGIFVRNRGRN